MTFQEALAQLEQDLKENLKTHAIRWDIDGNVWVSLTLHNNKGRYILNIVLDELHPGHDYECPQLALKDCQATDWIVCERP